jgi:hypothetical protein
MTAATIMSEYVTMCNAIKHLFGYRSLYFLAMLVSLQMPQTSTIRDRIIDSY